MSVDYDNYLNTHISNVDRAFTWLRFNLPEIADAANLTLSSFGYNHDSSKYTWEEYDAYDAYFYSQEDTKETKDNFNKAWLHHIHNNPHHWQHWVLINDDPKEGTVALDIPYKYVLEMICDWWSFSWASGNLYEIFDWYDAHKDYMILSANTREVVEDILNRIKAKLDESSISR